MGLSWLLLLLVGIKMKTRVVVPPPIASLSLSLSYYSIVMYSEGASTSAMARVIVSDSRSLENIRIVCGSCDTNYQQQTGVVGIFLIQIKTSENNQAAKTTSYF